MFIWGRKLEARVKEAKCSIADLFIRQCVDGPQSTDLGDALACGQFLPDGGGVYPAAQRGLHGTAAAILALRRRDETATASASRRAEDVIPKLIQYVQRRLQEEAEAPNGVSNTIKLSECLYAIAQLPEDQYPSVADVKRQLVQRLEAGRLQSRRGWGFVLSERPDQPAALPTAYAVLAMSSVGHSQDEAVDFLWEQVKPSAKTQSLLANMPDSTIRVVCLYAIVFRRTLNGDRKKDRQVRRCLVSLWRELEPLLAYPMEQNIEYWHKSKTLYVRIPWQLYLLRMAINTNSIVQIGSPIANTMIDWILNSAQHGKLVYPYSGTAPSARTNATAMELLREISSFRKPKSIWLHAIRSGVEPIRRVIASSVARLIILSLSVLFGGYCVMQWFWSSEHAPEDLAPEFIAAIVMALAASGKER